MRHRCARFFMECAGRCSERLASAGGCLRTGRPAGRFLTSHSVCASAVCIAGGGRCSVFTLPFFIFSSFGVSRGTRCCMFCSLRVLVWYGKRAQYSAGQQACRHQVVVFVSSPKFRSSSTRKRSGRCGSSNGTRRLLVWCR